MTEESLQMEGYLLLVRRLARGMKLRAGNVDLDDLVAAGMLGLAEALNRYKPNPDATFEAYARIRIVGAIYDELRQRDLLSRDERDVKKVLGKTFRLLGQHLGRRPDDIEMSEAMNMDVGKLQRLTSSLHRSCGQFPPQMADERELTPELALAARREQATLHSHLDALPERLRYVVRCYYFHDMGLREIGERLRLTESRICQLHAEAIKKLREAHRLGPDADRRFVAA